MHKSSRAIAITALLNLYKTREPLDAILTELFRVNPLADNDRQLTRAILATCLRRRQEIDAVLRHFSSRPLAKLDALVLAALRIGACQLLCLDKIPPSAAVNETVTGLGRQPKWVKGFVNGILRAVSRQPAKAEAIMSELAWPENSNHPDWLASLLNKQYGRSKAAEICANQNKQPALCLRLNSRLTSLAAYTEILEQAAILWQQGPAPLAILLPEYHGSIKNLPGYAEGHFHIQDAGAQLIGELFAPYPNGTYLDACAGLGGKTILLDQLLPTTATITAIDPHQGRYALLTQNLKRSCCRQINTVPLDLDQYAKEHNGSLFQGILIDAPCSGLGIIGRHPDIRWNRQAHELAKFQQTQLKLLNQAVDLLAPGGTLVYATCSLAEQENQDVVRLFLEQHLHFAISRPEAKAVIPYLSTEGYLVCLPSPSTDGFFACAFIKQK